MTDWLEMLCDALHSVEHGVVLLDDSVTVKFINRAYCRMWGLADALSGRACALDDLMRHVQDASIYRTAVRKLPNDVRRRCAPIKPESRSPSMYLRHSDGRIIKFESTALPGGGRMLTYVDETTLIHAIERLQILVALEEIAQ